MIIFRKSIRIAPGLRMTVGRRGLSVSAGPRGARVSASTTGRKTMSLSRLGLSWRKPL